MKKDYKKFTGILVSIDLVDFTKKMKKLGDIKGTQIKNTMFDIFKPIFREKEFEFIKDDGDTIFFFGNSDDSLLDLFIYFCKENKDYEFGKTKITYRFVGHSGTFNFKIENGKKTDISSNEMNFLCRMEKNASDFQFVISPILFEHLKDSLNHHPYDDTINSKKIKWKGTPKGFEDKEKQGLYLLKIKGGEEKKEEKENQIPKKQIKILSITASPKESNPIFYEREQDTLLEAFRNFDRKEVFLDIPDPVQSTLTEIEEYLADGHHDILQITAHGNIDEKGIGFLSFETAKGKFKKVEGKELSKCLLRLKKENKADVKIVILSSCHSARRELHLMPVAKVLHKAGIDAVIGMKESISNLSAIEFNVGFFKALIEKKTVKQAFADGKKAIAQGERKRQQNNPQLKMQTEIDIPVLLLNNENLTITDFSDNTIKIERLQSHDFEGARYLERGFIGRRDILRKIYQQIENLEPAVVLKGPGGIGKSSITTRVTANLKRKGYDFIIIREETGPERILEEISRQAKKKRITNSEAIFSANIDWNQKLNWFMKNYLSKEKIVLIFDNFEENQNLEEDGEFKNKILKEFMWQLRDYLEYKETVMLISTRYKIPSFDSINIGEFSNLEFRKMFMNGKALKTLKGECVEKLIYEIGGNPRAIDLLDKIAYEEFKERDFDWEELKKLIPDLEKRIIQGIKEEDFTPLFLNKILSYLNEHQLQLLKILSIYRRPINKEAIEIHNLALNRTDRIKLVNLSLIDYISILNLYYVHRLTANYVMNKINEPGKIELHKNAAKYWEKVAKATKYDTNWLEARYHYWEAKEFEKAAEIALGIADSHRIWGYIDSALELNIKTLRSNVSDKTKTDAMNSLGLVYSDLGKYKKALKYHQEALEINKLLDYKQGEAIDLGNIGKVYHHLGEPEKALKYLQEALEIIKQLGIKHGEAAALGNIGMIYNDLGEPEKALKYHQEALEINKQLGYKQGQADNLGNVGLIYKDLGEPKKALTNFNEILAIHRNISYKQGEALDLGNIGNIYSDLGEPEKALKYLNEAIEIYRQFGYKLGEASILGNIGLIYRDFGEPEKALKYLNEAIEIYRQFGYKLGEASTLGNIGLIYIALRKLEKALKYLQEALVIDRQLGYKQGEATQLGNIGTVYGSFGEPRKALKYHQEALEINKQLGYKQGQADNLGNIGNVYDTIGEPRKALKYLLMSFEIYIKIKSPKVKIILKGIKDIKSKINTDNFNKIVKEFETEPDKLEKIINFEEKSNTLVEFTRFILSLEKVKAEERKEGIKQIEELISKLPEQVPEEHKKYFQFLLAEAKNEDTTEIRKQLPENMLELYEKMKKSIKVNK